MQLSINKFLKELKPEPKVDDFYHYMRNITKRIESLRVCDDKINFRDVNIETKAKYYDDLKMLIFYTGRINALMEEDIMVVKQE